MHKFEQAGLGQAPFRVIGCFEDRGPHKHVGPGGVTVEVGSPGQPMGSCKYCGQGIAVCYVIRSSDGKEFTVGSDCVAKTGDNGIKGQVNVYKTKARNEATDNRIRMAYERFDSDSKVQEYLKTSYLPGNGNRALYGYIEWCKRGAGRAGKLKCSRMIEKAIKEVE